ncbi:hypothetical protein EN783_33310, partial [Mesorhizobium sp. M2D.F.Ca.ET.140.01.1.1]
VGEPGWTGVGAASAGGLSGFEAGGDASAGALSLEDAFGGGEPTAVVKPFYEHLGLELDPAQRKNFIDPAKSVLDKSDALRASGQGEC